MRNKKIEKKNDSNIKNLINVPVWNESKRNAWEKIQQSLIV